VCLKCGDLRDVHPQGLDTLELPRSKRFGYRIVNREVLFQGYCSDCGRPGTLPAAGSEAEGRRNTRPAWLTNAPSNALARPLMPRARSHPCMMEQLGTPPSVTCKPVSSSPRVLWHHPEIEPGRAPCHGPI